MWLDEAIQKMRIDNSSLSKNNKEYLYFKYGISAYKQKYINEIDFNKLLDKVVVFDYMKPQLSKEQLSVILCDQIDT